MNEFNLPQDGEEYVTSIILENPTRKPIHIMSGECKELNKKILYPREKLHLNLKIPAGQREFIKQHVLCGKQVLYIGTVDQDVMDPFIFNLDN